MISKICIIIPCYNESGRMPVDEIMENVNKNNHSFCFVNDGSKDNTLEILNDIMTKFPDRINILDQQPNVGKAEAVRKGVLYALDWKDFDYVGFLDADMATPISEMDNLLNYAVERKKRMVVGSRLKRLGVNIDRNTSRHYMGRIIATFISGILKLPTYDTQCGAKIFDKELTQYLFKDQFTSKWLFDVELFFRAKLLLKERIYDLVYEYPLNEWHEKGQSKVSLFYILKIPFELIKIKRKYKNF